MDTKNSRALITRTPTKRTSKTGLLPKIQRDQTKGQLTQEHRYVSMYIYMYHIGHIICMHIYTHDIYMYTYYIYTYVFILYIYKYIYICIYLPILHGLPSLSLRRADLGPWGPSSRSPCKALRIQPGRGLHMYIYICIYVNTYMYMCIWVYMYVCMYM